MVNRKRIIWLLSFGGVVLMLGAERYLYLQVRSLRQSVVSFEETTTWDSVTVKTASLLDDIVLDVGTIQFMRRGYSIQLEQVNYSADGLHLQGYVGNPTNLQLSNLTLDFEAYKPLDQYKEDILAASRAARSGGHIEHTYITPIGTAQSAPIAFLAPRTREPFGVTIPNVKQTEQGIWLRVSFSGGERYGY